jgi:hypothetical protein
MPPAILAITVLEELIKYSPELVEEFRKVFTLPADQVPAELAALRVKVAAEHFEDLAPSSAAQITAAAAKP